MKGPWPQDYESLYMAMAPVVTNLQQIMHDISSSPKRDSRYCWEALSYQAKSLAARIDHVVGLEMKAKAREHVALLVVHLTVGPCARGQCG